jgi:hypothetical protein
LNDSEADDCEPRKTDPQTDAPTHRVKVWHRDMLWEAGLIMLVTSVMTFCALNFSA